MEVPKSAIHTATIPGINRVWEAALPYAERQDHERGSYIYPYENENDSFYYIASGSVTILHETADGHVRNMLYMQTGNLINVAHTLGRAFTSFFDSGCRFYCMSDVELWKFPSSLLRDGNFVRQYPALIINLMESIGFKLLLMHNALSYSGTGDALARLCRFCINFSQANENKLVIAPGIATAELANILGVHRISLFRAARKLRNMGILGECSRHRIVIRDIDGLMKLAAG